MVPAMIPLAGGPIFSLNNTNFVVALGFILFICVLLYAGVPGMLTKALDARAEKIRADIDEARKLREEAQTILAGYERKMREVEGQAQDIVASARAEAKAAAEEAKASLARSMERRLAAASDQIASAEDSAVKEVKDRAVAVAVEAAREVMTRKMTGAERAKLAGNAIEEVGRRLN